MKCESCKQTAHVHVTTLVADKRVTIVLCECCANRLEADGLRDRRVVEATDALRAAAAVWADQPPPVCEGCGKVPMIYVRENHLGVQAGRHLCEQGMTQRLDPWEKEHFRHWAGSAAETAEWMKRVDRLLAEAEARYGPIGSDAESQ